MTDLEKIHELSEQLTFPSYESMPDIELYMDQVLDFLSRSKASLRDDDKLSSAMVNNYIKAELLPRARGKKYSREHLVYLSVIMRLKQVLSVKDTGSLIRLDKGERTDEEFYNEFLKMVKNGAEDVSEKVLNGDGSFMDVAMRLAVESYLSKIACEYMIDEMYRREKEKKESEKKTE